MLVSLFISINKLLENTTITGKDPVAKLFNTSEIVKLSTTFTDVNYGDVKYFCFYGPEKGDIYRNITSANLTNSVFSCELFSETIAAFSVSIWMESFGTKRIIVKDPEQFLFIGNQIF